MDHCAFARLQGATALLQREVSLRHIRWPRQRQVRPARRCGRLFTRQLRGRCADGDGRGGSQRRDSGGAFAWRSTRMRAGGLSSRAGEGSDPGRNRGRYRSRLSIPDTQTFPCQARAVRGLGQVQPRLLACELSRLRRALHTQCLLGAAFDQADRGRHRLGEPNHRPRPSQDGRREGDPARVSMSARPCIAKSAAQC